jgi:hypothetical protein
MDALQRGLELARRMVYLEQQARRAELEHDQERARTCWEARENVATQRSVLLRSDEFRRARERMVVHAR